MSRCAACDVNMNDFETTRKIVRTDGSIYYPDLCNTCFKASGLSQIVEVIERYDLMHNNDEEIENEQ